MTFDLLLEIAARSSLLFAAALLVAAAMRRRSAAERHLALASVLAAGLLLPLGLCALPEWAWKVWSAPGTTAKFTVTSGSPSAPPKLETPASAVLSPTGNRVHQVRSVDFVAAILVAGMALQVMWLGFGAWGLRRIRQRAVAATLPDSFFGPAMRMPRVLVSGHTRVAFLVGLLRPVVVLPAGALNWPDEKLRMVLWHEIAHLQRRDHWLLVLCGGVRVVYWWNPLAWLVLARLRRERERACDDMVIGRFRASDYASLLVEVAQVAVEQRCRTAPLAMAAGPGIEGRVRAVLDGSVSRSLPARRIGIGVLGIMTGVAVLLSTVRLVEADSEVAGAGPVAPKPTEGAVPMQTSRQIEVEAKLVEVPAEDTTPAVKALDDALSQKTPMTNAQFQQLLRKVDQVKGVDLASTPRITTEPDTPFTIGLTREFKFISRYRQQADGKLEAAKLDQRNIGIELNFVSMLAGGHIVLSGSIKNTEFEGFTESEPGAQMPVFNINETRVIREVADGETAGMWMPWERMDEQTIKDVESSGAQSVTKKHVRRRLAVFLTAHLVDVPIPAASAASPTPAPTAPAGSMPYGTPVAGKPGYVKSPFASDDGEVDVRGFPSNTEVKCPYSGRIFRVP